MAAQDIIQSKGAIVVVVRRSRRNTLFQSIVDDLQETLAIAVVALWAFSTATVMLLGSGILGAIFDVFLFCCCCL